MAQRKHVPSMDQAKARYRKAKTKSFSMTFFPDDMPLYEHLQKQEKKAAYIKSLIAADMEKQEAENADPES